MADRKLFQELEARGIVKQVTDRALADALAGGSLTLYCGFDPTADSLHVGSLLPLLTLRRFQLAGHSVIAVVGGATGMIGDPSGRAQERSLLTEEVIAKNLQGITAVISRFLDLKGTSGLPPARIANNADWFRGFSYLGFLRDVGKHFTINHMMAKESVRARLEDREHGISYTEFSYMLVQAFDFHHLYRKDGCRLQIGGSDQWGNITAGIELIRRMRAAEAPGGPIQEDTPEVFGLTHPLVTKADGAKFGKTETGTLWLDAGRTSPYELYQFFIQTADADVGTYLRYFTFLPLVEIEALERAVASNPSARAAQQALAREMTRLIHGEEALAKSEAASRALFGGSLKDLDERALLDTLKGAPSTDKARASLEAPGGLGLLDLLVETGLCASKGAARKDIGMGGINVNDERVSDVAKTLGPGDLIAGSYLVLRKGKKNYHLVRFA